MASLNFILFRSSFAGEQVAGFVNPTFDHVAFRHFTKKCSCFFLWRRAAVGFCLAVRAALRPAHGSPCLGYQTGS